MDPRFREDDEYWGQVHQRGLDCPVGARLDVPFWKTGDRLPSFPIRNPSFPLSAFVIPAKAGIQKIVRTPWIPAFARMTNKGARMTNIGGKCTSEASIVP
ncbi:MAG: hypothetical protein DIKNOCCD_00001 [bacterium]|nr:hypothetical protein [bacterium]